MFDVAAALENTYSEVDGMNFYRDIFPVGSFEERGIYEDGKYNGIVVSIPKGANQTHRFTVTDDLEILSDLAATDDFCLMSPISYIGKSRKSSNARFMYALAIDLDGVNTLKEWQFFMNQVEFGHEMQGFVWGLPKPTYLISSGTGIHIYYVFEKPIPMFSNIVEQLEVLKKRLTWQAWTQGASSLHDNVQYESLFQGFRVVGTITKNGGRCRAFKVGEKVTIEYLNQYVPENYRTKDFTYKSDLRLADAKEKYPEWYQTRIVEQRPKKTWQCKKDLYDWWIRKVLDKGEQGHRYWCIMTLATYAKKCGVSRETLEKDAYSLAPILNARGDPFTEDDVLHALEAYTDSYITYPIDTIVYRTGIPIQKNKRNWRKQADHIKLMNFVRDEINRNVNWREGNGRPKGSGTAEKKVHEWRQLHPDGKPKDCIKETGISKNTVYKWWKEIDEENRINELKKYTKKAKMMELPFEEQQAKAMEIMAEAQKIARERGISEEEGFEVFVYGKPQKELLQAKMSEIVVPESQFTPSMLFSFDDNVRSITVVSDEEYMDSVAIEAMEAFLKDYKNGVI